MKRKRKLSTSEMLECTESTFYSVLEEVGRLTKKEDIEEALLLMASKAEMVPREIILKRAQKIIQIDCPERLKLQAHLSAILFYAAVSFIVQRKMDLFPEEEYQQEITYVHTRLLVLIGAERDSNEVLRGILGFSKPASERVAKKDGM